MKRLFIVMHALGSISAFACDSKEKLCNGDSVISDSGLSGKVRAVLPDGQVMVKFDGYDSFNKWPTERLARIKGCTEDRILCANTEIVSDSGLPGIVRGILPNNQVMVKFNGYDSFNKWPTNRLAPAYGCTFNNYCVGNKIISDNGLPGSVEAILLDGQVMVKFDGYDSYNKWPTDRLSQTKGCTTNDYCVGDIIISDNGIPGEVKAISPDGQVMVKFDGYDSYNKWPTNRLAVTDACTDRN